MSNTVNQETGNPAFTKGTRVTFIDYNGKLMKITYIDSAGRIRRWRMPREGHPDLLASEEGVTWIRGHHANDSLGVRAMLAAYSLARESQEPDRVVAQQALDRIDNISRRNTP